MGKICSKILEYPSIIDTIISRHESYIAVIGRMLLKSIVIIEALTTMGAIANTVNFAGVLMCIITISVWIVVITSS